MFVIGDGVVSSRRFPRRSAAAIVRCVLPAWLVAGLLIAPSVGSGEENPPVVSIDDVSVVEGASGATSAIFTVSLINPSDQDVTVDYATVDSTATLANDDYTAASGTLTIAANTLSATVTVVVNGDAKFEGDETFVVDLSGATNASIGDDQGVGTITNDDGIPSLSIADVTVAEGDAGATQAVFTVSLSNTTDQTVTVDYATADGSATLGNNDYVNTSGTLTIPAKTSSGTITVAVNGDTKFEGDETFVVNLSGATHATIADNQAVGTISNDDGIPSLAIGDVTVTEGNAGTVAAVFAVNLSNTTDQTVTVDYTTADGSATLANNDYVSSSGTLTIPPKASGGTITVVINGDTKFEGDQTFVADLSGATNASLADAQGIATITNDDGIPSLSIADVTVAEGDAGATQAVFTVNLSNTTDQTVTVDYTTADGSATLANSDYVSTSGTLTIPAKAASGTVTVVVNGDTKFEGDQTFSLNLSGATHASIGDDQGAGTITNDDGIPSLSIADVTVAEGDAGAAQAVFTVSLSNATDQTVTVDYATADGSATLANSDYVSTSGTLTIPAKAASGTVTVVVNGDTKFEGDQTFSLNLSGATHASIGDDQGAGTITNDDGIPSLSIADVTVAEGDAGATQAVFTVSLSNTTDQTVTVDYTTADGSATLANSDYVSTSGTLTIPAKAASGTVTVVVNGDTKFEGDQTFSLNLSGATHASIGDDQGAGTITNDDGIPSLSIADVTVAEGDAGAAQAVFTVSLSNATDQTVTVDYATADGSATLANSDYVSTSGTLTIPAKAASGTVTVVVNGDTKFEGDQTFSLNLSGATHASIGDDQGAGTITNDDGIPSLSIADVTVAEGDAGATQAVFTVNLSNTTDQTVTVDYTTADGSATLANSDYVSTSGTLTIPAKAASGTVTVVVNGDTKFESDQTFSLNLSGATHATIADNQAVGTITNDDGIPSLAIGDVTVTEGNAGTVAAVFAVNLSNTTDQTVTVDYTTADGSATLANNDYVSSSGTLTIPPKASGGTITVVINGDTKFEGDETFTVNLSNAVNATVADAQGIGTITNDDGTPSLVIGDVTVTEGNAGTVAAVFAVNLSNTTDQTVTVNWATSDGSATLANNDYLAASGTLTIPTKAAGGTITVTVNGDTKREGDETFVVNLSNPVNATVADAQGIGTITNDDGTPSLAIGDVTVTEGNAGTVAAVFAVNLSNTTDQTVTVNWATSDGSATLANNDYLAASGTLTIPAKAAGGTITVLVNGDTKREGDETFVVNLSNPTNASLADAQGIGTITNDDGTPSVAIGDVTVTEGNAGTVAAVFTVGLSNTTDQTVTVGYTTADGSATLANSDYVSTSGTLTIPAKATSGTITVLVNGDTKREGDETFNVNLSNPTNASLADAQGIGTITNDDGTPSVAIGDVTVTEGNAGTVAAVFTVGLSNTTDQTVTVGYATADGSATLANSDYVSTSGTLTIPAKAAGGTITVLVNGDTKREGDETFVVNLSNPTNASLADAQGIGTITNDDGTPSVAIGDVTVTEGNAGTVAAVFTVSLSNPTDQAVTVGYATADGSATLGNNDYVNASGTLLIPPKTSSGTITVLVKGDTKREDDETFTVNLSGATNATIADGQGIGTILNDDGVPSLSIGDVSVTEGMAGTTIGAVFMVSLSNPTDQAVTVDYATADSTATAASGDYQAAAGSVTIPADSLSATLTVVVNGDLVLEPAEVFQVRLDHPVSATIGTPRGIGTIMNHERQLHATFVGTGAGLTPYAGGTFVMAWADYDHDGDVDLPLQVNNGLGGFSEMPGFVDLLGAGNYHGTAWTDYDKDGHQDMVVMAYDGVTDGPAFAHAVSPGGRRPITTEFSRTLLLHNRGDGTFEDVAPQLGLDIAGHGETPVWGDFDGDGWPDLFTPYYAYIYPYRSFLYHNQGDGTFTEVGDSAGVSLPGLPEALKPEGADAADFDDDGDLDIYTASHLFQNDGYGRFTDIRAAVGLPQRFDEGATFLDFDNDGDLDLYVRNSDTGRIFRNDGGQFVDATPGSGIQPAGFLWGDAWADVDNDGDLDFLYFVRDEPARLMLNRGDGTFVQDSTFTGGDLRFGMAAWADYDQDGDLDFVTGESVYTLYKNQLNTQPRFPGSFVRVRVLDADGRENERGATVRMRRMDAPMGPVQTRVVGGGCAYLAHSEYTVHFGAIDDGPYELEVSYPSAPDERVIITSEETPLLANISPNVLAGRTIAVYRDGRVLLEGHAHDVGVPPVTGARRTAMLDPPFPNPMHDGGSMDFRLAKAARVALSVCDVTGRSVRRLVQGALPSGSRRVHWDGRDDQGREVAAGIYFVRLVVEGRVAGSRRIVVLH